MHAQAATLHEQSLSLGRQAGDTWTIASALMNAADLARVMREFERAIALLKESLGHYQTLRAAWGICIILDMMAVIAADAGNPNGRRACSGRSRRCATQSDPPRTSRGERNTSEAWLPCGACWAKKPSPLCRQKDT